MEAFRNDILFAKASLEEQMSLNKSGKELFHQWELYVFLAGVKLTKGNSLFRYFHLAIVRGHLVQGQNDYVWLYGLILDRQTCLDIVFHYY